MIPTRPVLFAALVCAFLSAFPAQASNKGYYDGTTITDRGTSVKSSAQMPKPLPPADADTSSAPEPAMEETSVLPA